MKNINSAQSVQRKVGKREKRQPNGSPKAADGYRAFLKRHKLAKGTMAGTEAGR